MDIEKRINNAIKRFPFVDEALIIHSFHEIDKLQKLNSLDVFSLARSLDWKNKSVLMLSFILEIWKKSKYDKKENSSKKKPIYIDNNQMEIMIVAPILKVWSKGVNINEAKWNMHIKMNCFFDFSKNEHQVWLVPFGTIINDLEAFVYDKRGISPILL